MGVEPTKRTRQNEAISLYPFTINRSSATQYTYFAFISSDGVVLPLPSKIVVFDQKSHSGSLRFLWVKRFLSTTMFFEWAHSLPSVSFFSCNSSCEFTSPSEPSLVRYLDERTSLDRWFASVQGSAPSTGWLGSERSPLYPNKVLAVEKMQSVAYLPL